MEELEKMRHQMAILKEKLDSQVIINQTLMKDVMRSKSSWLDKFVKAELISLPFIYLLFVGICYFYNISQWYAFAFLIIGGIDSLMDLRTVVIPSSLFGSSSIISLKKFLIKQKRERFIQTCISGTLCVIWIILFFSAMATSGSSSSDSDLLDSVKMGGLIGGVIGAVIGLIIVIVLYYKMQNTNDSLLRDIEELQNE